ncbi:MAG TPA: substrate-binding domain-containing protein [Rhizomicrobium sp.]|jgi:molybdate transport system substrate-binding protein|nr:substrate-binding domain-containing protein [Rhizomicrobium sp.]
MFRIIVPALVFCFAAGNVSAKDLNILTGAGMSMPVKALAADFGARTGTHVTVVSDTAGGVQKRMEQGEKFDLVIGTEAVIDTLTKEDKVAAAHEKLAQMVAGIGAKADTPKPAIADGPAVKATLLAARNIAYVDPAMGGITGVFFLQQADKLGIGSQVRAKAVLMPNGSGVAEAVAGGHAQYGVTLISEMLPNKGVTVWPLPDDLQMTTIYAAALATNAENAMDATAMLNDLRGPKGRDASLNAGLKPVGN